MSGAALQRKRRSNALDTISDLDMTTIAGCALWLRADRGLTLDGSGAVSAWADQSGNGRHYTQGTAANRPTVAARGMNGRQAIAFDGHNAQYLVGPSLAALAAGGEIFIAMKVGASTQMDFAHFGSYAVAGSLLYGRQFYDTFATSSGRRNPSALVSNNATLIYNVTSIAGEWTMRLNGAQVFSTSTNAVGWDPIASYLGAASAGGGGVPGGAYWYGSFGEIVVFDHKLSPADRAQVESALERQWRFGPSSVDGCVLFLRASDGLTLSGSDVAFWADISGHNRNFAPPAGHAPTYSATGFNGGPAVMFSAAAQQYLVGPTLAGLVRGGDAFALIQRSSGVDVGLWRFGAYAAETRITSGGVVSDPFGSSSKVYTGAALLGAAAPHLYNVATASNGQYVQRIDYNAVNDSGIGGASVLGWDAAGSLLGASSAGGITPSLFFDGALALLAVYDGITTDADRLAISQEMKSIGSIA